MNSPDNAPLFKNFTLNPWRQFGAVSIDFDRRITVLTGVNGSGKSTILRIMARQLNYTDRFVATAVLNSGGGLSYDPGIDDFDINARPQTINRVELGTISYTTGKSVIVRLPAVVNTEYSVEFDSEGYENVSGVYLPSRRPHGNYHAIDSLPVRKPTFEGIFTDWVRATNYEMMGDAARESWARSNIIVPPHPHMILKRSLVNARFYSFAQPHIGIRGDKRCRAFLDGFQALLRNLLPVDLGFQGFAFRSAEILMDTSIGVFDFDAVSGGILALIELCWPLYLKAFLKDEPFVALIDEPENHLHPKLQQTLLPILMEQAIFSKVQWVVASHNPLIVSSVKDATIFALHFEDRIDGFGSPRVVSTNVSAPNLSQTADQILRDILGLEYTIPVWAAKRLIAITNEYSAKDLTDDDLDSLQVKLEEIGLSDHFSTEVASILLKKLNQ